MINRISQKVYCIILIVIILVSGCSVSKISQNNELTYSNDKNENPKKILSEEEKERIEILTIALNCASGSSIIDFLSDNAVYSEDTQKNIEIQANFLSGLANAKPRDRLTDMLQNNVQCIDEEGMSATFDEIMTLISMAGMVPAKGLENYLKNNYAEAEVNNELITLPILEEGESVLEFEIKEVLLLNDGYISVLGITKSEPDYGMIYSFELSLKPDKSSIFGGYIMQRFIKNIADAPGNQRIGADQIIQTSYVKPESKSDNPYDYIFEFDHYLYQMPFPVKELIRNGWSMEEIGELDVGGRKRVCLQKAGQKVSFILWNYGKEPCANEGGDVVWMKTNESGNWANVEFNVDGISKGTKKENLTNYAIRLRSLWENDYYGRRDPLYGNHYGFEVFFEGDSVAGFEMGYAPNPIDRRQRVIQLTGDWRNDPVIEAPYGSVIDVSAGHIYTIDIDGDGLEETIDIRYLDEVDWGKHALCVIINGEATQVVEGETGILCDNVMIKIILKDGKWILEIKGEDVPGNEIVKEFNLKKRNCEIRTIVINGIKIK